MKKASLCACSDHRKISLTLGCGSAEGQKRRLPLSRSKEETRKVIIINDQRFEREREIFSWIQPFSLSLLISSSLLPFLSFLAKSMFPAFVFSFSFRFDPRCLGHGISSVEKISNSSLCSSVLPFVRMCHLPI